MPDKCRILASYALYEYLTIRLSTALSHLGTSVSIHEVKKFESRVLFICYTALVNSRNESCRWLAFTFRKLSY